MSDLKVVISRKDLDLLLKCFRKISCPAAMAEMEGADEVLVPRKLLDEVLKDGCSSHLRLELCRVGAFRSCVACVVRSWSFPRRPRSWLARRRWAWA